MRKIVSLLLVLVLVASCNKDDGGNSDSVINCTDIFVFGLSITVRDVVTTTPIESGITVTATDGAYSEDLIYEGDSWLGAGERQGTYVITITGSDYMTFTSDPIEVTGDECHVDTQSRDFTLIRI